jgi:hypothetical protein
MIGAGLTVRELGGSIKIGGSVRGNVLYGNSPAPFTGANLTVTGTVGGTLTADGTPFANTVTFAASSKVGHDVTVSRSRVLTNARRAPERRTSVLRGRPVTHDDVAD